MYLWTWKMLLFLKVAGQEWWCSTCSTVSNDAMTLHKSIIAPANHRPQTFQHYGHQPAHSKRKPSRIIIKTCHWNLPGQCKKIRCSHAQHQEWKRTPQQIRCTQLVVNQHLFFNLMHHRGMKLRLSPLPQDCTRSEGFLTSSAPVDGPFVKLYSSMALVAGVSTSASKTKLWAENLTLSPSLVTCPKCHTIIFSIKVKIFAET